MFVSFIKICSCNDLHVASNEAKQSCKVVNLLQCFECTGPPPPLELIQLPAKKHSLTTYKEKKPLLLEDSPAFLPHMVVFLYLPGYPLTCSYCLSH